MNTEKAMIIALLLSDGSVYFDKSKKTYCLQFTNKVAALRERFCDLMKREFGLTNFHINKCKNAESARFFSKKIALELFEFTPSFRTLRFADGSYPPAIIPNEVLESVELAKPFLQAYASCDGCVVANKKSGQYRVEVACYHPVIRSQLVKLFELLGFNAFATEKRVILRGKSEVKRFIDAVGFLPESTVCNETSPFYGVAKNSVLGNEFLGLPAKPPTCSCPPHGVRSAVTK